MKDAVKSEWHVRPLGEVVTLNYGKALARSERDPNGSIPVYGANGVMDWCEHTLTQGPSLVIGRKGSAGEVTRVDGPFWPSDVTYYTTHDHNTLDFDFLHYTLQTLNLPNMARGVKPGINRNDVYSLPIPLPPLEEQQRIVAVLDEALEGLARARAHAEANLQNARELYTANVETLLARVGDDWSVGPLFKLVGQVATGPFGSLLHKSDYVEDETPLVNPANIIDGKIVSDIRKTVNSSALERLSSYILKADDIVIGRRGEMGRCAVVEPEQSGWLCGTGSFFIRPNSDVAPKFVAHVLRSPSYVAKLEAASTGATMANLSNRILGNLEVALPNLEQQLEYLEAIEGFDAAVERLEILFSAKLLDLDDLRQSILQKAFSGELTRHNE